MTSEKLEGESMKSYIKENNEDEGEKICPLYNTKFCYNDCNWFGNCPDQERGDALPDNMGICSSCGRVVNKGAMEHLNTGRRVQLLCAKCYKNGSWNVKARNFAKTRNIIMEKEKSRRR